MTVWLWAIASALVLGTARLFGRNVPAHSVARSPWRSVKRLLRRRTFRS